MEIPNVAQNDPRRRQIVDDIFSEARSGTSQYSNELDDQTKVAFGFGKRTVGFHPSDLTR